MHIGERKKAGIFSAMESLEFVFQQNVTYWAGSFSSLIESKLITELDCCEDTGATVFFNLELVCVCHFFLICSASLDSQVFL